MTIPVQAAGAEQVRFLLVRAVGPAGTAEHDRSEVAHSRLSPASAGDG